MPRPPSLQRWRSGSQARGLAHLATSLQEPPKPWEQTPPHAFNNASVYAVGLLLCGTLMDTGDEEG